MTPILSLQEIAEGVASQAALVNQALRQFEARTVRVLSKSTTAPPGSPAESDSYIIPTGSPVSWAGTANQIASYIGGAWSYFTPLEGVSVWVNDVNLRYTYDGAAWVSATAGGDALVANPLSQFAATTSAQLAGVISDETGSGALVFATSPTLVTPALGTPSAAVLTNATGLPVAGGGTGVASLTAYAPVFGGTTSTGAVQSGTAGTSGHVLTSNGAGVLPTFQAAAAGGSRLDQITTGTADSTLTTSGFVTVNSGAGAANTVGKTITIQPGAGGATNAAGGPLNATGGTGAGTGVGGAVTVTGGTPGSTGIGGGITLQGATANVTTGGRGGGISILSGPAGPNSSGGDIICTTAVGGSNSVPGNFTVSAGVISITAQATYGQAVTIAAGSIPAGTAGALSLSAGIATNSATAGALTANGGDANSSGFSGAATFRGGDGSGSSSAGGNATLRAGDSFRSAGGSELPGALTIRAGNAGGAGNSATGGAVTITGGSGGAGSASVGGAVTIQGGAASAVAGSTGGAASVVAAAGSATGTGAAGASVSITAGNAGGSAANAGGDITLKTGTATSTGKPGNVVLNGTGSALATTATGGFTCIPTCAGTPTGVPASIPTGTVPMVFDTTGVKLWIYTGGAWKGVVVA